MQPKDSAFSRGGQWPVIRLTSDSQMLKVLTATRLSSQQVPTLYLVCVVGLNVPEGARS